VAWLLEPGFLDALESCGATAHVLREDAEARGLASLAGAREGMLVDRAGWVRLVEAHHQVLSWT